MLNPVHLRTLAAVISTGSFAEAARSLGYTGSAVSQQMASLERTVRLPLFEREAHRVCPTPAAQMLADQAHDAVAALVALEDDMRALGKGTLGRVRIGSFPTASERLVPAALGEYVSSHPGVEISLNEDEPQELIARLVDAELDVALVYVYDLVPRRWPRLLRHNPLLDESLFLLLPEGHPQTANESVSLRDLQDERWVSSRQGTSGASFLRRICGAEGFEPSVGFRSNDYDVIREFVRTSLGIALVPALGHVDSDGVVARRVEGFEAQRHVFILHRPHELNPAIADATAALKSAAKRLAAGVDGLSLPDKP